MATALPRPLQPPVDPPTSALPPIPSAKGRKSLPAQLAGAASRLPTHPQTPAKLRTPSKAGLPVPSTSASATPSQPQHASSTPSVPTLKSTGSRIATPSAAGAAAAAGADRGVRRSVSIAAFPQPPKSAVAARAGGAGGRPSLGGTLVTTNLDKSLPKEPGSSSGSTPGSAAPPSSGLAKPKRLKKTPSSIALHGAYAGGGTAPSLLNGSGESVPVSAGAGSGRGSGSQLGLPSPPRSRSSSAQGSYSTSATTFEDVEEAPGQARGRDEAREGSERRGRSSGKETKGNVLVSVRVRPDEGGDLKSEGEWMVDGRRSLVAFKGKEGGDYYYGPSCPALGTSFRMH